MDASQVARVVLALAAGAVLAVLGAHPRVLRRERRFGLTVLVAAGEANSGSLHAPSLLQEVQTDGNPMAQRS